MCVHALVRMPRCHLDATYQLQRKRTFPRSTPRVRAGGYQYPGIWPTGPPLPIALEPVGVSTMVITPAPTTTAYSVLATQETLLPSHPFSRPRGMHHGHESAATALPHGDVGGVYGDVGDLPLLLQPPLPSPPQPPSSVSYEDAVRIAWTPQAPSGRGEGGERRRGEFTASPHSVGVTFPAVAIEAVFLSFGDASTMTRAARRDNDNDQ